MSDYESPAYSLSEVIEKAKVGFIHVRHQAQDDAEALDFDLRDIIECISSLRQSDFAKSMDAENPRWHDCRQDVYKPTYNGIELYVKLQYWPHKTKRLYVVSFKRK